MMLETQHSVVPSSVDCSVDALEREIATLAAHLNAATYRFLTLIADFDRRCGWDGFGIRSCAHWLNWKCGIGLVAAREKLRVAHALEHLPLICDAMQRGALSYAKVRAVTRVATPENEEFLLTIAQNGTASHVETVVRHYRRTQRLEELEQENARHEARSLRYYWDEDGCLVIEGRLPPEQGAIVVKALEAADQVLRAATDGSRSCEVQALVDPSGAAGASSVAANAEDRRNEAFSLVNETARTVELATDNVPDGARDSAEAPRGQAARADALFGSSPSWSNRQADALALMAETLLARGPEGLRGGDKHVVHVHVDLAALHDPHGEGQSAIEGGPAVPPETVRRLCCDGGLVTWLEDASGRTLDVGRKTRAIPPALRRALEKRDQGCRFPGCTNRRFVDAHHIEHWVDGGETKLENLTLLCRYHHRLVHKGGFQIAGEGGLVHFATPDGCAILAVPPVPEVPRPGARALCEQHGGLGLAIDEETAVCDWRGERPDYGYMVKVLWQLDDATAGGAGAATPRVVAG